MYLPREGIVVAGDDSAAEDDHDKDEDYKVGNVVLPGRRYSGGLDNSGSMTRN